VIRGDLVEEKDEGRHSGCELPVRTDTQPQMNANERECGKGLTTEITEDTERTGTEF
jgi:hypothetical protein